MTTNTITFYATTNTGFTNALYIYRSTNLLMNPWYLAASNIARSNTGTNTWTDSAPPQASSVFYKPALTTN